MISVKYVLCSFGPAFTFGRSGCVCGMFGYVSCAVAFGMARRFSGCVICRGWWEGLGMGVTTCSRFDGFRVFFAWLLVCFVCVLWNLGH